MKFAPIVSKEIEEFTEALSFAEMLMAQYSGGKMPKRERTRTSLLLATDRLLESIPLEKITIEQIVAKSGLARGTFYQHFQSTNEIIVSLLGQFYEAFWKHRPSNFSAETAFERIYVYRLYYVKSFEKNAHLFMHFRFFSHRNGELATLRMNQVERWVKQLEKELKNDKLHAGRLTNNRAQLKALLRSTGILWSETLVEYFVFRDSVFHLNIKNIKELTNLSMLMWNRIIFGCDPDCSEIRIIRSNEKDV